MAQHYPTTQSGLTTTGVPLNIAGWRNTLGAIRSSGVIGSYGDDALQVYTSGGTTYVRAGAAQVEGFTYEEPTQAPITIPINSGTSNRRDLVVIRFDPLANPPVNKLVRTGSGSPPSPLRSNTGTYETVLAEIVVAPGAVAPSQIIDKRVFIGPDIVTAASTDTIYTGALPRGSVVSEADNGYRPKIWNGSSWINPMPEPRAWHMQAPSFTRWAANVADNNARTIFWTDIPDQGPGIYSIRFQVELLLRLHVRADTFLYAGQQVTTPALRNIAISEKATVVSGDPAEDDWIANPVADAHMAWNGPLRIVGQVKRIFGSGTWSNPTTVNGGVDVVFWPSSSAGGNLLTNSNA